MFASIVSLGTQMSKLPRRVMWIYILLMFALKKNNTFLKEKDYNIF